MNYYFWWQGTSVNSLTELLVNHPGARLEVHFTPDGQHATFHVIPEGTVAPDGGGINESHICPPQCP